MCRISGIISKNVNEQIVVDMRDSLHSGGPDDSGYFIDKESHIGLGHRRLSILDTSSAGHQPMSWGKFVIVYNGEVYNFKEIAAELEKLGYHISSGSDTEVILKSFECWGYSCVNKFRGMFAFAIWDKSDEKLILCRDRIGTKPLYYYLKDDLFMFASELKSFHVHEDFDKSIDFKAVSLFLQTGYIKSPYSIFQFAHKLEPGGFLEIDKNLKIRKWKYWSAREIYKNTEINSDADSKIISDCESLLMDSFNLRMVSDVPVGMFLSGGVDSSIVTALLQQTSSKPLNTFTIGFENKKFNEAQHAKKIAKHIGTNHTELYCDENDFKNIIPLIPDMYDEPFGDSSAIPTFLVSKLAREKVKVSLSADGGDEIFGGYTRYFLTNKYYTKLNNTPFFLRNFVRNALGTISIDTIRKLNNFITGNKLNNLDARIPKLVEVLKSNSEIDFLYSATKNLSEKELLKLSENKEIESIFERDLPFFSNRKLTAYGLLDIESYLEGDIMAKVDRATMKVALEGREPFLDHKIIEFAFGLPDKMKFRDGETKWILRRILYNYVPKELIDRPKMGFGIPLDNWLNTYLKDDLQLISSDSYFCEKFRLRQHEVKKIINLYLNGKYNNPTTIWFLYILHKWYLRWF